MPASTDQYLIDTNVWSAIIRRTDRKLLEHFARLNRTHLKLSLIVWGELQLGYYKGDKDPKRLKVLDYILQNSELLPFDLAVANRYAMLRATLEIKGTPIGANDTWIAAEALHHGLIVVTNNRREFERVEGLRVENWA